MDVLQKEIEDVYDSQCITDVLDPCVVERRRVFIRSLTAMDGGCAVISDLSVRKSYVAVHPHTSFLGLTLDETQLEVIDSTDEDYIYRRIHPEDLVEKRLLEYKYFKRTFAMPANERLKLRGRCRLRMVSGKGTYQYVDNVVQIMENTPSGNVWLIFCSYSLSADQHTDQGICATITHLENATVEALWLGDEHHRILSQREKEVLGCIRTGMQSKEIADVLHISVNTVNRHRQNILEKLSVGNSLEACRAAELMNLL